jgi:hypothetical protein
VIKPKASSKGAAKLNCSARCNDESSKCKNERKHLLLQVLAHELWCDSPRCRDLGRHRSSRALEEEAHGPNAPSRNDKFLTRPK